MKYTIATLRILLLDTDSDDFVTIEFRRFCDYTNLLNFFFKSGPNSGPDRIETIWSGPQFYSDFKKCFENSDQLKHRFFFIAIGTGEDFRIEFRAKKSGPYK